MLYFDIAMTLGYPKAMARSSKGHGKVKSTEKNWKYFVFCCVSIITFTSDDKVISRSQQGQIIYKKLVIIACFAAFATIMLTLDYAKNLGWLLYDARPQPISPCVGVDGV